MRDAWPGVWAQPQDDSKDALPLSWVARLGEQSPEWQVPITESLATLFLENSEGLGYAALVLFREVPWNPVPAIADWIVREQSTLKAVQSPDRRDLTLLGELVHIIKARELESLPAQLAEVLAAVDVAADGYPESLVLASALAPDRYLRRVPSLFEDVDDRSLETRVLMLLNAPAPVCDEGFSIIAESAPELALRVATVVKSSLDAAAERVEANLANPNLPESVKDMLRKARGSHAERWRDLARRLGADGSRAEPRKT